MTASDDDTPVTAHRVIDGPPTFAWTDEPFLPAVLDGPPRAGGDRPAHARDGHGGGTGADPVAPGRPTWSEDGAVYFQLGTWIDGYGVVYDPDGSTPWSRNESLAPGWYQWMG